MQDCSESLRWLTSTLMERNCHPHFAAAHAEGCCHLCHSPLREVIPDCPCPHWFLSAFATQARLHEVAAMVDVSDLVQFLALCIYSQRIEAGGPASAHVVADHAGLLLHLRLRNRQWTVHFAGNAPASCTVVLRKVRSGKCETVALNLSDRDQRLLTMLRTLCQARTSKRDATSGNAEDGDDPAPRPRVGRGRPPKFTLGYAPSGLATVVSLENQAEVALGFGTAAFTMDAGHLAHAAPGPCAAAGGRRPVPDMVPLASTAAPNASATPGPVTATVT